LEPENAEYKIGEVKAKKCIYALKNMEYLASHETFRDALCRRALKSRQASDEFHRLSAFLHAHKLAKKGAGCHTLFCVDLEENTRQYAAGQLMESHAEQPSYLRSETRFGHLWAARFFLEGDHDDEYCDDRCMSKRLCFTIVQQGILVKFQSVAVKKKTAV
jgi:hypothetical protein